MSDDRKSNHVPDTVTLLSGDLLARRPMNVTDSTPKSIRHYQVRQEIGRGGMGVVYEGHDRQLDRRVAIKSISWDREIDQLRIERFRREARLLASLHHPNIGSVFSFEETQSGHYLILEFIEGQTLARLLAGGSMPLREAIATCRQIAEALIAAHEQGVAHRDLSANNVMVRPDGHVKVLDFGLARSIGDSTTRAGKQTTGVIQGTPNYMSPETLTGHRSRAAADIWAFACLLFECVTGQRAFAAPTGAQLVHKILHDPPALDLLPEGTPDSLRSLLIHCFEKDPSSRLGDLSEALSSLDTGSTEIGPGLASIRSSAQPLQRVAGVNDPLLLRVFVENPRVDETSIMVQIEDVEGWHATPISDPAPTLAGKASQEIFFKLKSPLAIPPRLPEVRLRIRDEERRMLPVPSTVSLRQSRSQRLIGREHAWLELTARLESVESRCGELTLLGGEPGSGKTFMLDRFDAAAREAGVRTLRSGARSGMGSLRVMHDLLRTLLGVVEAEHRDETLEDFARCRLQEYLGRRSPNVDHFLSLVVGREDHSQRLPSHDRDSAQVMNDLRWYRLFAAAARGIPCLLLLDDLDRADSSSIELLRVILERAREDGVPIAVVATIRSKESSTAGTLDGLIDGALVTLRLEIERFSVEETDDFLAARYPGSSHRDYTSGLAHEIHARTGGHAGMTSEYVDLLSKPSPERECLFEQHGDAWRVRPEISPEACLAELPSQYVEIIERRLDPISDRARPVLETAGLLGSEVSVRVLEELVDDTELLDDALDELESLGLLEPIDAELTRYRFTNPSYPMLVARRLEQRGSRRAMRRRSQVARCLERLYDDPKQAEELGLRLLDLGEPNAALPHLFTALDRRIQQREVPEADHLLCRVDEIIARYGPKDDRQRFEWLSLSGRVHTLSGRLERALEFSHQALNLAEQWNDLGGKALSLNQLAEIAFRRSEFNQAAKLATQAIELSEGESWADVRTSAVNTLAIARRRLGDPSGALDLWESNRQYFIQTSDRAGEAAASNNIGVVHYYEGRYEEAAQNFQRTIQLAKELDNLDYATQSQVWLSNIAFNQGQLNDARDGYLAAITAFQRVQNRRALSRNYQNLAEVAVLLGDLEAALPASERAATLCREMNDLSTAAEYQLSSVEVEWLAGHPQQARERLAAVLAEAAIVDPTRARVFQIRAALMGDRLGDAQPLLDLALEDPESAALPADSRLLQYTAILLANRARHESTPDLVLEEAAHLLRSETGYANLMERVGLAAAIVGPGPSSSIQVYERLDMTPGSCPAQTYLDLVLPKLTEERGT